MESGTIFYIIAVIIYFIYSFLAQKKAQNQEGQAEEGGELPEEEASTKKSFDELLRDIRREQEERERDIVFTGEKAPQNPDNNREEQAPLPQSGAGMEKEPETEKVYERLSQSQPLVKLDDQVDIHDDEPILGEVESEFKAVRSNPYAKRLKDPRTLREAIVVSEILQRKHF